MTKFQWTLGIINVICAIILAGVIIVDNSSYNYFFLALNCFFAWYNFSLASK